VTPSETNPTLATLSRHFEATSRTLPLRNLEDWGALGRMVPFLDTRNRERLAEAFGARVGWVLIEDQYIDRDYRDTFSHIFSRRFATPPSRCQRLHFFDRSVEHAAGPTVDRLGDNVVRDSYMGYAVIRPTRPNGLGRVLLSSRICNSAGTGAEASLCEEKVMLFGHPFSIRGFPFIGQDIDVSTCAQATIWMLRRYYSNRYHQYGETRPYELSQLAARHLHGDRSFPATGLSDWQMAEMLRALGFSPMIYSKSKFPRINEWLVSYLDSGLPLVLCFDPPKSGGADKPALETPGHAVACFGFNGREDFFPEGPRGTDVWPGSYRTSTVLVNDDNYPPYLAVGPNGPPDRYPGAPQFGDISSIIVPLPERISLLAEQFDSHVRAMTEKGDWSLAKKSPILNQLCVDRKLHLRLYVTTCRNLKQDLSVQNQPDKRVETTYRLMPLPHFVWVCEFHDHSKPWDQRCLGEVLWDATCNEHERQGMLALHYPETLVINTAPVFENRVNSAVDDWTEIPLQGQHADTYSPAPASLSKI